MFERTKLILVACIAAFAALSPLIGGMNPYYFNILISVGISLILAVGLNLVNGYTGQFSLGHAGFMAVGAYLAAAMSLGILFPYLDPPQWAPTAEELAADPQATVAKWTYPFKALWLLFGWLINALFWCHNHIIPLGAALPGWGKFLFALFYGGAIAALAGLTVGVPSLRLKGDYLAIVTLGFNEIIRVVLQSADPVGASRGLPGIPLATNFFWTFTFAALAIYVVWNIVHSTYGRGFLAVRDDEIAAEAMGINTTKYKVLAFVIAAFFAGIAGGLYAHFFQYINPEGFNFMKSVDIVVMVILGGMGSMWGVCAAAVLLTILPEVLRKVAKIEALPEWAREIAENRMIIYSLILIILMLARPQGLFAGWVKKKTRPA